MAKAFFLGCYIMLLCFTPQLATILLGKNSTPRVLQDPDDYAQLLIAQESWEKGTWWSKETHVDAPITGRPDHWSQIPRLWLVGGAATLQTILPQSKKSALRSWGYWSNGVLFLLAAGFLATAFYQTGRNPLTGALLSNFVLNLPTTRWAANIGHPDHHLWIITATALLGAYLITNRTKAAGLAAGTLYALSPLTFLPIILPIAALQWFKPTTQRSNILLWTGSSALLLWILEYGANPNFSRFEAPNPWIPLLLITSTQILHPNRGIKQVTRIITILGGIILAGLAIKYPDQHFTPLSEAWRTHTKSEGIYGPTKWYDPLYFTPLLPFLFLLLTQKGRKTIGKFPNLLASTGGGTIAATIASRAHEGISALSPAWAYQFPEKTLKKVLIPTIIILALVGALLPNNPPMTEIQEIGQKLPQGSITASHPTYNIPLAYWNNGQAITSHHWENWPKNLFYYQIVEEKTPQEFLKKLQKENIQYFITGPSLNSTPPINSAADKLQKGESLPGINLIFQTKTLHVYKVDPFP